MSARIEEMLVESDLDRAEMGDVFDLLAPLGELSEAGPAPSEELAELFAATGPVSGVSTLAARRRSAVAGAVVLAVSAVGATGLSAAANTLPRPLQHGVSQFSQRYLPFDLPEPPPHSKSPLGMKVVPPSYPLIEAGRAGEPTTRSLPGRDPALAPNTTGRPAPEDAQKPAASPSASPTYATFGVGSSESPSAQPSPSDSPSSSEDTDGRPAASPSSEPPDKKPGKGTGKGGHDGKGQAHGHGPSDPDGQGNSAPVADPGGQDPAPTSSPLPEIPVPTLPVPDPLPDLGPVGGTGPVDPGADAG